MVVLKGDDTLVADPSGTVAVSRRRQPGAGDRRQGDVLTGVIAALLAQGLAAFTAAAAGVLLHARRRPSRGARPGRGRGRDRR